MPKVNVIIKAYLVVDVGTGGYEPDPDWAGIATDVMHDSGVYTAIEAAVRALPKKGPVTLMEEDGLVTEVWDEGFNAELT